MSEIRCVKGGITFRLFGSRASAIQAASSLNRINGVQHRAKPVRETGGFVVVSADSKWMYDSAGTMPERALALLKNRGAYLEWYVE